MPTTLWQELLPLLPFAILFLGIALIAIAGSKVSPRLRHLFVAGAAAGSLVSILVLWTQSVWSVTLTTLSFQGASLSPGPAIHFSPDPWGVFSALLMTIVAVLVSLATLGYQVARGSAGLSLLALAGGLAVSMSANLFTLVVCWGLVDLTLLGFNSWHAFDRNEVASVSWRAALAHLAGFGLWGVMLVQTLSGDIALTATCRLIMTAAGLVRLGVFPLPLPTSHGKRVPIGTATIAQTVSMACGAQLLARLASEGLPMEEPAITTIAIALLITAVLAWQARDRHRGLYYVMANQAAGIALAFYLAPHGGMILALLLLANTAFCLSTVAGEGKHLPGGMGLWDLAAPFVGLASLAGIPPSAGFAARWGLVAIALIQGRGAIVVISTISNVLIVAPLLRRAHFLWEQSGEADRIPSWASRIALGGLVVLAILIVVLGLFPHALDRFATWGPPATTSLVPSMRVKPSTSTMLLITLLIPTVGGYLFHRLWLLIPPQPSRVTTIFAEIVSLDWVYLALQWLIRKARGILRIGAEFTERGLYLGWTLVWVLVLLFWLFGEV